MAKLLIADLRKLISERSSLQLPLAPWECLFGQKSKAYYKEEKERFLSCLEKLKAQEQVRKVSTELVLQLIISAWSLRYRLQTARDHALRPLVQATGDIAVNYGLAHIWRERFYSDMLEQLSTTI